jgi:5-methylcytosine-specific restriction endonuclease McrA
VARSVDEWVGKTDDAYPSKACQLRILKRQERTCADGRVRPCCVDCGRPLGPGNPFEFDHEKEIWEGGENRESNLFARCEVPCHERKTAAASGRRAKADAGRVRYFGLKTPTQKKSERRKRPSKFLKKADGRVVDRETGEQVWPRPPRNP